ncbi:MAG: NAD(P)/FAD-dependent oxidoreductase [Ktedonobacteraceae bacterium]
MTQIRQNSKQEEPPTTLTPPHVVILGGGFGGLQAARALGKAPVHVTIIDRRNYHLFQPLLYQVATATLSAADISSPIRHILSDQENTEILMAEVTGVDVQRQQVMTRDLLTQEEHFISYDYLIVSTGAHENYFGHDNWRQFAPGLKTIEDARAIRSKILLAFETAEMETDPERRKALLTFVLVGGGPTGVELAGAVAELAHMSLSSDFRHIHPASARIILVEALPRILGTFPPSLASKAEAALKRLGVEVRTNAPVEAIEDGALMIAGERLAAHTIIWTAGVKASGAGGWLGAETDRAGRVLVERDLTLPGHANVFVIGDTSHVLHQDPPFPGLAPVAMQQGRYVASVIRRRMAGKRAVRPFRYFNKGNLATVGRGFGIVDLGGPLRLTGFLAWLMWLVVHIYFLIGFRNRLVVMIQWAWAYLTQQRGARIITFENVPGELNLPRQATASQSEKARSHSEKHVPVELSE